MKEPKTIYDLKSVENTRIKKGVVCIPHDPFYIKNKDGTEAVHPFIFDSLISLSDLRKLGRQWIKYIKSDSYLKSELINAYQIDVIRKIFNLREKKCKTKN